MKIVVLDGYTLNPGDNGWDAVERAGDLTVYDRTPEDKILERALELGLECRAHTDQLSNIGGTRLAASLGALSPPYPRSSSTRTLCSFRSAG